MSASIWSRSSITRSPAAGHCHCFCRRAFSVSAIKGKARASSRHVYPAPANTRIPDRRIPRGKLIWALLLASGVASFAINLRNARDQYKALQSHHAAQVSVLKDLIHRLEQGVPIDEDRLRLDYERVGLVDRAQPAYIPESLTWKEMLFGRTKTPEQIRAEDAETAALEKCTKTQLRVLGRT